MIPLDPNGRIFFNFSKYITPLSPSSNNQEELDQFCQSFRFRKLGMTAEKVLGHFITVELFITYPTYDIKCNWNVFLISRKLYLPHKQRIISTLDHIFIFSNINNAQYAEIFTK